MLPIPLNFSDTERAILMMVIATAAASGMNVIIRHLTFSLNLLEILFFRCLFGFLVFLPVFFRHGLVPLQTNRHGLHIVRAIM